MRNYCSLDVLAILESKNGAGDDVWQKLAVVMSIGFALLRVSTNVPNAVVEYKDKYTETLLKFQITVSRLS